MLLIDCGRDEGYVERKLALLSDLVKPRGGSRRDPYRLGLRPFPRSPSPAALCASAPSFSLRLCDRLTPMTAQILFDRLAYVDRLKAGSFSEQQARAAADALGDALAETVATKADIAGVETKIDQLENKLEVRFAGIEGPNRGIPREHHSMDRRRRHRHVHYRRSRRLLHLQAYALTTRPPRPAEAVLVDSDLTKVPPGGRQLAASELSARSPTS